MRRSLNGALKLSTSTNDLEKRKLCEKNFNKDVLSNESKKHKRNISEESSHWPIKTEESPHTPNEQCTEFFKESLAKYKSEKQSEITAELFVLSHFTYRT